MSATVVRVRCEECSEKIPKFQPILVCDICNCIKHLKCQKLTKSQAIYIKQLNIKWTCYQCLSQILPLEATFSYSTPKPTKIKIKCTSCNGYSYTQKNICVCHWCNGNVHVKCWNGDLGCNSCCEKTIPGFHAYTHELYGLEHCLNNEIHNPYSSSNFVMQIGNAIDNEEEQNNVWSDVSDILVNCKYKIMKEIETPDDNNLYIFSLNVQHLRNKIDKIREDIEKYKNYDILCFNECNLKLKTLPHGIDDILLDGFHKPLLQEPIRASGRGGGLAIYVNKRVCDDEDDIKTFNPNPEPLNTAGEFQFIKIKNCKTSRKTIIIGNVYRSPSRKPDAFVSLYESVLQNLHKYSKKKLAFIVGDFNQDLIQCETDVHSQNLVDTAVSHGFIQLVSRPTRVTENSATLIDQVYTNNIDSILSCNIITLDLSDHLAIHTRVSLNSGGTRVIRAKNVKDRQNREFRVFNEANNQTFHNRIEEETWDEIDENSDAQSQYDKFSEIYMGHYNAAYPPKNQNKKRKNERNDPKPWILPWLEDACARKNVLYNKFVKKPSEANKTAYEKMKTFCNKHTKRAKNKYYDRFFKEYNDNSRKQWQMINGLLNRTKNRVNIRKLIDDDGNIANTPAAIAENFNEYFANIATNLKSKNTNGAEQDYSSFRQFLRHPVQNSIYINPVDPSEVYEVIKQFKNKYTRDTGISALKIANTSYNFTSTVAKMINKSFSEGVFPRQLKNARVIPVFKEGSKCEVENYRPISLLSSLSKIYEKLMHNKIMNFLELNNSIHENQYGFRSGRSCEHALLTAQQTLLDSLSKHQVSLLLLIDFSKAFDMVDHKILLDKLENYGIRGMALKWLKSYLENRTQFVTIDGIDSSTKQMEYGVPQGSILGPLLFVIYINDLPNISKFAKFIMYADDANIILTGKNIVEINEQLMVIRDELEKWVGHNGLALNLKKTKYMIFSRQQTEKQLPSPFTLGNILIEHKTEARFLGVIIDDKLTWSSHIKALQAKMSRYIGIMYKLKSLLPLKTRIQIYHSFVQSHINYCSLIWGFSAKSNIEKLFCAQKKGIRAVVPGFINYKYRASNRGGIIPGHTKEYFKKFNIMTVHGVIVTNTLLFMHKVRHFSHTLPPSVLHTIAKNSPSPGSTFESCQDWLNYINNHIFFKSVFFKGPLLSIIPEISVYIVRQSLFSLNFYKSSIKRHLLNVQSLGLEEWKSDNFLLYNIPGLRSSLRETVGDICYVE